MEKEVLGMEKRWSGGKRGNGHEEVKGGRTEREEM